MTSPTDDLRANALPTVSDIGNSTESKTCTKCKQGKPLTAFSKNKTASDGLHQNCKACHAKYTASRQRTGRGDPISRSFTPTTDYRYLLSAETRGRLEASEKGGTV